MNALLVHVDEWSKHGEKGEEASNCPQGYSTHFQQTRLSKHLTWRSIWIRQKAYKNTILNFYLRLGRLEIFSYIMNISKMILIALFESPGYMIREMNRPNLACQ